MKTFTSLFFLSCLYVVNAQNGFTRFTNPAAGQGQTCLRDSSHLLYMDTVTNQFTIVHRSLYYYDAAQRLVTSEYYDRKPTSFTLNTRFNYTYDAAGNRLAEKQEKASGSVPLSNHRLTTYTYSANNELISQITFQWQFAAGWHPLDRFDFQYAGGMLTEKIDFDYNPNTSLWLKAVREVYTYNSSGQLTKIEHQLWGQSGPWYPSRQDLYSYTVGGHVDTILIQYIDSQSNWQDKVRHTYSYNNLNQKTSYQRDYYSSTSWKPMKRYLYSYNSKGQQVLEEWLGPKGTSFDTIMRTHKAYDQSGNDTLLT